jgi:hypothetical protein
MISPFDVFQTEADGSVYWFGAFTDLEAAKARVHELLESYPAEYFIFSQATGHKLFFKSQRPPNSRQFGNDSDLGGG